MTVKSMKYIMLGGLICNCLGMIGLGLVVYLENDIAFALVSALMRLVTGTVNYTTYLRGLLAAS